MRVRSFAVAIITVVGVAAWVSTAASASSGRRHSPESRVATSSGNSITHIIQTKGVSISSGTDQVSAAAAAIEPVITSSQFANTYAGDVQNPDGTVTIYVANGGDAGIRSALSRVLTPSESSAYTIRDVAHSYADLEALTRQISGDEAYQNQIGADLTSWGPDITANDVQIKLLSYTPSTAAALKARYGSAVSAVPANGTGLGQRTTNRFYDTPPFYAGDRVFFNNNSGKCTAAFALRGNRSGNIFSTTAGHCGGSAVLTNLTVRYTMGPVSTNYFSSDKNKDIETFTCNCAQPIWYANQATHTVAGLCGSCGYHSLVTADGASTNNGNEVTDATVVETGICVNFPDGRTCNLNGADKVVNGSYVVVCGPGDSGGPIYQRASSNRVFAAGTIVGVDATGYECYHGA